MQPFPFLPSDRAFPLRRRGIPPSGILVPSLGAFLSRFSASETTLQPISSSSADATLFPYPLQIKSSSIRPSVLRHQARAFFIFLCLGRFPSLKPLPSGARSAAPFVPIGGSRVPRLQATLSSLIAVPAGSTAPIPTDLFDSESGSFATSGRCRGRNRRTSSERLIYFCGKSRSFGHFPLGMKPFF